MTLIGPWFSYFSMTSGKKALITHRLTDLKVLKTKLGNNTIARDNVKFGAKFLNHHFGIALLDVYIHPGIIATVASDLTSSDETNVGLRRLTKKRNNIGLNLRKVASY